YKLEKVISEQEKCADQKDFTRFVELDVLFHAEIALISNNKKLYEFIENLNIQLQRFLILTDIVHDISQSSIEEHKEILTAFKEKDINKAKKSMLYHIQNI